ncbi:pilin [Virgisporangium aurantiacum]|uniref:TrbC/VIRB2 family protein n=1 Tax=Virgisporangium aurantiacum TaxID=175570 RepID=A0A8J3Z871_9ACTN|nr:pilin [Virgisporangium aurantiacum]GIJ59144.1 hypothetical protein Vau01_066600 [Virgisporangium aurantiacum]
MNPNRTRSHAVTRALTRLQVDAVNPSASRPATTPASTPAIVSVVAVVCIAATLLLLVGGDPARAEPAPPAPPTPQDLPTVINNARLWIMGIIAAVATFFLTVGGARYMMAGGDPQEVERAKGSFKSAGIGYALALLAPVILTILNKILGG